MSEKQERLLRVGSATNVAKLASSIFSAYTENPEADVSLRVIGAGALNQAVKGIIISNKQFVKNGKIAYIMPSFQNFDNDNTSIVLHLKIHTL